MVAPINCGSACIQAGTTQNFCTPTTWTKDLYLDRYNAKGSAIEPYVADTMGNQNPQYSGPIKNGNSFTLRSLSWISWGNNTSTFFGDAGDASQMNAGLDAAAGAAGGAAYGTAVLPGVGTVVGAAFGAISGAIAGAIQGAYANAMYTFTNVPNIDGTYNLPSTFQFEINGESCGHNGVIKYGDKIQIMSKRSSKYLRCAFEAADHGTCNLLPLQWDTDKKCEDTSWFTFEIIPGDDPSSGLGSNKKIGDTICYGDIIYIKHTADKGGDTYISAADGGEVWNVRTATFNQNYAMMILPPTGTIFTNYSNEQKMWNQSKQERMQIKDPIRSQYVAPPKKDNPFPYWIIGVVVGVIFLICICVIIFFMMRKNK